MKGRGRITFQVPHRGFAIAVTAARGIMADRREGLHSLRMTLVPVSVTVEHLEARDDVRRCVLFLNGLIDAGMPWSALASCRHSPGVTGALIEAGANRLLECAGGCDAA